MFTDSTSLNSKIWNIIKIDFPDLDPRMIAKIFKVNPHLFFPKYEYSIWIDANIKIVGNLEKLIDKYLLNDIIAFFKHPTRKCIYDEAMHLIKLGYINEKSIKDQISFYKNKDYPKKNGLVAGRFILRRHNDMKCIELMKLWWKEIQKFTIRDQLSFNYVSWYKKQNYNIIDLDHFNNEYFFINPHNKISFHGNKKNYFKYFKSKTIYFITSRKIYRKYIRNYYKKLKL